MALETLRPTASETLSLVNYSSGDWDTVNDDPDSPDGNWLIWDTSGNSSARTTLATPTGNPTTGSGLQEFRCQIREDGGTGSNDCVYSLELWENGVIVGAVTPTTGIVTTAEVISLTWDAVELSTADGSLVEIMMLQTNGGTGNPASRRGLEVGAMEWNVDYDSGASAVFMKHPDLNGITVGGPFFANPIG